MNTTIQFRTEQQTGKHTYAVEVRTEQGPRGPAAGSKVTVELVGVQPDGTIIAEGGLVLPANDVAVAGQLLEQTLQGVAVLNGSKPPSRTRRSPENAGTPWTAEQDAQLRETWLASEANIADLSAQFGRSRWAIRARLIHVGCDPDQPGLARQDNTPVSSVEQEFDS